MPKFDPVDPVEVVRQQMRPPLQDLLAQLERDGNAEGEAFFSTVAMGLERANEEVSLAELFVHLSTVAFVGIEFTAEQARLVDRVLEGAEQFAQVFSADTSHPH